MVSMVSGGTPDPGVTYGSFADGTARRVSFSPGVEHIGVLYSPESMAQARDWLDNGVRAQRQWLSRRARSGAWSPVFWAHASGLAARGASSARVGSSNGGGASLAQASSRRDRACDPYPADPMEDADELSSHPARRLHNHPFRILWPSYACRALARHAAAVPRRRKPRHRPAYAVATWANQASSPRCNADRSAAVNAHAARANDRERQSERMKSSAVTQRIAALPWHRTRLQPPPAPPVRKPLSYKNSFAATLLVAAYSIFAFGAAPRPVRAVLLADP